MEAKLKKQETKFWSIIYKQQRKKVPGKKFDTEHVCGCKTNYECKKFAVSDRQVIFDSYLQLGNFDLQNATLIGLIDERPVYKRTIVQNMEESGVATGSDDNRCYKNLSRSYHLPSADGRKQVC